MRDPIREEVERFTGRKLPTPLIVAAALALVALVLWGLVWPLVEGAHLRRTALKHGSEIGCAAPAVPMALPPVSLATAVEAEEGDAARITKAQEAVASQIAYVSVVTNDSDGSPQPARGSAFVYAKGIVITAEHVVGSRNKLYPIFVTCDGIYREATVVRKNATLDVAILSAPGCKGRRLTLSTSPPRDGENLVAAGYLFGPPPSWNRGIPAPYVQARVADADSRLTLADLYDDPRESPFFREMHRLIRDHLTEIERRGLPRYLAVKGVVQPGQSGSPLTSADGAVVGIYIIRSPEMHRSFYAPAAAILRVLRGDGKPE